MTRRGFGAVRKRPSGRYSASYIGLDEVRHFAPTTFESKLDAEAWLMARRTEMSGGDWKPPIKAVAFGDYAETWLEGRDLKPRTRALYRGLLDKWILPTFERTALRAITPESVRSWYSRLPREQKTLKANAYGLLRTILGTAQTDDLIVANPCRIKGAGSKKRVRQIKPLTPAEISALVDALPERYRLMTLLAVATGLRFGAITALQKSDIEGNVIHVRRGVTAVKGGFVEGTPKTDAGRRAVTIPGHLMAALTERLEILSDDEWVFPSRNGQNLSGSSLYRVWDRARKKIGRPDLRFHDLRHTQGVLLALSGASLHEIMARLGHTSPNTSLLYLHVAKGRDAELAKRLEQMLG